MAAILLPSSTFIRQQPIGAIEYALRRITEANFPSLSCCFFGHPLMLVASNITIQFGSKPLFENVSVKFGDGNRYGLIGANGSGKTTFMKILAGVIDSSAGNVSLDPGER
ncbi:MAG TPA: ATP-binding cassette domain-containing protein, partial [Rugosibacter sp.]